MEIYYIYDEDDEYGKQDPYMDLGFPTREDAQWYIDNTLPEHTRYVYHIGFLTVHTMESIKC